MSMTFRTKKIIVQVLVVVIWWVFDRQFKLIQRWEIVVTIINFSVFFNFFLVSKRRRRIINLYNWYLSSYLVLFCVNRNSFSFLSHLVEHGNTCVYCPLAMELTRANSRREANMKIVLTRNQMSMNFTYWTRDTFSFTFLCKFMKVNQLAVPVDS